MRKTGFKRRILSSLCVIALLLVQAFVLVDFTWHESVYAAYSAGTNLEVRVQYYGERGDKIRVKATFSRADLEAMGASTYYYSNITKVGGVMTMAARGPQVTTILDKAGIDLGSIQNITFSTDDGYTRNFTVGGHLTSTRYYYPNLSALSEQTGSQTIYVQEGALEGAKTVPAILALEFGESKAPGANAGSLSMSTSKTYRFCIGQTKLTEGSETRPGYDGGDVTSMDSCHSINGIDVTLSGSPAVTEIKLDIGDSNLKVGSKKKVSAVIIAEGFIDDYYDESDLVWKSSDTSIATVDEKGNVTVKKKGAVTITATAPNGVSASITINGKAGEVAGKGRTDSAKDERNSSERKKTVEVKAITAKVVTLGDEIVPQTSMSDESRTESMAEDAAALDEGEQFSKGAAAGTIGTLSAAFTVGLVYRIRRFRIDK